jgi:hypothetical protein
MTNVVRGLALVMPAGLESRALAARVLRLIS